MSSYGGKLTECLRAAVVNTFMERHRKWSTQSGQNQPSVLSSWPDSALRGCVNGARSVLEFRGHQ